MKKSITLLGGEGFIGLNIIEFLRQEYTCFSVANESSLFSGENSFLIQADPYQEKVEVSTGVIVHLIDNQVEGEVFEKAEQRLIANTFTSQLNHVILFSSAVIYAAPNSPYGKRKKILERIFQEECDQRGIQLTIFRLFNTYGKYQIPRRQGSLIANIIFNHLTNQATEISNILNTRDFMYAGDIGKFVKYVIERNITGTFDLSSNCLVQLEKIIELLQQHIFQEKISFINQGSPEDHSPVGNNMFLEPVPLTSLSEGLKKTVEFYKENIERVESLIK